MVKRYRLFDTAVLSTVSSSLSLIRMTRQSKQWKTHEKWRGKCEAKGTAENAADHAIIYLGAADDAAIYVAAADELANYVAIYGR